MLDGPRPMLMAGGAHAPRVSRRGSAALLALLAGPGALGCQASEPRPGSLPCTDPACADYVYPPRPVTSEPSGSAGAGGQGGGGGMPEVTTRLTGTVFELSGADLGAALPLFGQVRVRVEGVDGGDPVEAAPRSDGAYQLDEAPLERNLWVAVGTFQTPPSDLYLDTLQPVDSTGSGVADLYVVPREAMEALAASAYLINPRELEPSRGHVLMRFVDRDGEPAAGVSITFPDPSEVPPAYDGGGVFSDALEETAEQGAAVLVNLAAPRWPGAPETIVAEYAGRRFQLQPLVAADSVSLVSAVVPDP